MTTMNHQTRVFTRKSIYTLLLFWFAAAFLMFLNGLRYGHAEVAVIRNLYLCFLGAVVCLPVSLVIERFKAAPLQKIIFTSVLMAGIGSALISFVLNPLTLSLLGAGTESFTLSALTNQSVVFFLLLLAWCWLCYSQAAHFSSLNTDKLVEQDSVKAGRTFELKDRDEIIKIQHSAIVAITANGDYVSYHTKNKRYLANERLQNLAQELAPLGFKRIHRSTLVNEQHVQSVNELGRGLYELTLTGPLTLKSSKTYAETVRLLIPIKN